ncbi:hypothetical protein BO86DRAFT_442644 [Aspergillus japonicus CBS 114.51]|uniref:Ankyrin n=1 Tax=Aspergillus japonicus CBS 114.51 TaxID=1448312 RepID=A0A8T8X8K4_ASPJA|nr:hypothetical protein BO86DRAFT_442644 [Aspergillus japonicus CBS 114.51]RAH84330.1 hypothetical protein BO86DRAFT_442644 [Aspergillus japonicus CBS 114.51]
MARPSRQKRAAKMRANLRRREAQQQQRQSRSPQQTENQPSTEGKMQLANDENDIPIDMPAPLENNIANENELSESPKQALQLPADANADNTEGAIMPSTQHDTKPADEDEAPNPPMQIEQPPNDAKETTEDVSELSTQFETPASGDEHQQHANQDTDDSTHIKQETQATTQHETNTTTHDTPVTVKQEETQPTDTEETTERVSQLAKKRRKRPVPAPQPRIPAPQPPALTQPTTNKPPAPKTSKRKASAPAETIDLSSPKPSPKKRKARVTAEVIDLCSPGPSPKDPGQRQSPKNLRKRKPADPPETIPIKRARSSMPTSPRRTRSYTRQAAQQPPQVQPKEYPQKRRGARRVEWADRETRKQPTVAQQDATSIKKEEQPRRILRDRSQIRKPGHAQSQVKREPASQPPHTPTPEETPFHTPLQQALLHQTQAVTDTTYDVLERQLATTQTTAARRAATTTTTTTTDTETNTETDPDTDTDHAHDPIPPLPLGQVLNVAKYFNTNILSRLTQTCKTLYRNLVQELHLRQHATVIPDRAWQRQIRLSQADAEGRRSVEWLPSTGYYPGPMELATQHGRVDDVRSYLLKGADRDRLNAYGIRPLRWAVATGQLEIVQLLLEDHADPNLADADGSGGALAGPFVGPDGETETMIERLLAAGAQLINMEAFVAVIHARKSVEYLKHALANGSARTVGQLRGPSNSTALHLAAQTGQKAVVGVLLRETEGLALDAVNDHGQSALHFALRDGNEETALALIDAGCALDRLDNFNRDALALAVERGYAEVVRALLEAPAEAGVDFRATRKYGHRPSAEMTHLEGAFTYRRFGIMKQLLLGREHAVDEVLQRRCRELARTDPTYGELCEDVSLLMGSCMLGFDSEEREGGGVRYD